MPRLRLGTRSSDVAVRRARRVAGRLAGRVEVEIVPIKVDGERRLSAPIDAATIRGLYTKQVDSALRRKRIDAAVHAVEDMPADADESFTIAAILARDDPGDAIVFFRGAEAANLAELTSGSRVGASSWRRRAQLRALRGDLEIAQLNGDLAERVRKLDRGAVHAMIASVAGLDLLGIAERPCERLAGPGWLAAAGQGATAVQVRSGDDQWSELFAALNDDGAARDTAAERAVVAGLADGAQVPVGAQVILEGMVPVLHAFLADPDGETVIRAEHTLDPSDPEGTGQRLASIIRLRGGESILEALRERDTVPHPQPDS